MSLLLVAMPGAPSSFLFLVASLLLVALSKARAHHEEGHVNREEVMPQRMTEGPLLFGLRLPGEKRPLRWPMPTGET